MRYRGTQRPALLRALFIFAGLAATCHAFGADTPRVPLRDEVVETQLLPPAVKQSVQRLQSMKANVGAAVNRRSPAERIDNARRLIQAGRASGDPRTLGYAEAALADIADTGPAGVEVLVLRATIEQSRHRFDTARALLDRAI